MTDPVPHRGEVWWADVPGDKIRPVLVAPVTTRVRGIPTEVGLHETDGLPRPCAANFDNVFTLRRDRLRERIAALSAARMDEVCLAYRFAVGC